jgi:hypothetical protein
MRIPAENLLALLVVALPTTANSFQLKTSLTLFALAKTVQSFQLIKASPFVSSPGRFVSPPLMMATSIEDDILDQVLEVAILASKRAGEIIIGNAGGAEVTERKANSRDLLTLIDPLCEKIIRETVIESFPLHSFLGEEDVPPGKEASAQALDTALTTNEKGWLW